MKNKLIIITGGHHNSALVLAKFLIKNGYQILWLGHKHSFQLNNSLSEEYKEIIAANIEFINLDTGKIHRGNLLQWYKFFKAFNFCIKLFKKRKPSLIIGFGGYLSPPAIVVGWLLKIRTVGHEQTSSLGLANRAVLAFVDKMFLAWPKSFKLNIFWKLYVKFFANKFIVSGLPVKRTSLSPNLDLHKYFKDINKPLLLVSGGKQGSHTINLAFQKILPKLLAKYNVLHQTGNNSEYNDLQNLQIYRQELTLREQQSYYLIGYSSNFDQFLRLSDVVVGRSGAHTVFDLLRFYKKTVAIPLVFSFANEQYYNAVKLEELGLGIILEQNQLNSENLLRTIEQAFDIVIDKQKVDQFLQQIPKDSCKFLLQKIEKLI